MHVVHDFVFSTTVAHTVVYSASCQFFSALKLPHMFCLFNVYGGHGGRVVTLSPPTSEAGVRSPARPQLGKLVLACRWSEVYSTEP